MDISNYWDDFPQRVTGTVKAIEEGGLPSLERLTVHLTDSCNLNCIYCNMKLKNKFMDFALAKRIVDEYAEAGGNIIHFTGGEPSIVPYIEELVEYANNGGLQVSMNTNAVKRIDVTHVDKLKASFDAFDAVTFRELYGTDAFERVVENMKYYSAEMEDKMLSITTVLNRQNFREMLDLATFIFDNFKIYNLYYSNYKGRDPRFAFSDEEIDELFGMYIPMTLDYLESIGQEYSHKQLSLYKTEDFSDSDERFPINRTLPCYIQLSEMTVDIHGDCYDCSHLFRDNVRYENPVSLEGYSLMDAFAELKRRQDSHILLHSKCLSGCNRNLIGFNSTVDRELG